MALEIFLADKSNDGTDSPDDKSSRDRLVYFVTGSTDISAVKSLFYATAPATHEGLVFGNLQHASLGADIWKLTGNYIDPQKKEEDEDRSVGESIFSWDTTGNTQHISVSKETKQRVASSLTHEPVPNFLKAIGVNDDRVEGVDVVVPGLKYSVSHTLAQASVTLAYIRTLRDLTGTTNAAAFHGFAIGEMLFLGSTGQESSAGDIDGRFDFLIGENLTNHDIGFVDPINKKAHDYLWYHFEPEEDTTAKSLIRRPTSVHIERVTEPGDFSLLLI
ncbi:MAG: hypothetical protein COA78_24735 [Blastopirellula sp.]|nr:MAG: hypothetical protein COA78_24735 [Blastopirellula sp.]